MEILIGFIATAVPLVLTNNVIMSVIKYLAGHTATNVWLRGMLTGLSFLGVVATAVLTGEPVDFNQVSDLAVAALTAIAVAIASHFSYKVIKHA